MEGTQIGTATGKDNWAEYALIEQLYSSDATPVGH